MEAYRRSGRTQADFALLWGVSVMTLSKWLQRHAEGGGKALVTQRRGGPGRPLEALLGLPGHGGACLHGGLPPWAT